MARHNLHLPYRRWSLSLLIVIQPDVILSRWSGYANMLFCSFYCNSGALKCVFQPMWQNRHRCGCDLSHSPCYLGNRMLMNFSLSLHFAIKAIWIINVDEFQDVNLGFHEVSLKLPPNIVVWVVFSFSHLHSGMRNSLCLGWSLIYWHPAMWGSKHMEEWPEIWRMWGTPEKIAPQMER